MFLSKSCLNRKKEQKVLYLISLKKFFTTKLIISFAPQNITMKKTVEKENYLKIIYKKQEKGMPVNVTSLSRYFKVSKSTVSNMIKKLVVMGLIDTKTL